MDTMPVMSSHNQQQQQSEAKNWTQQRRHRKTFEQATFLHEGEPRCAPSTLKIYNAHGAIIAAECTMELSV